MDALVCPLCRTALTAVEDVSAQVCPRDGHAGVAVHWWPVPTGLLQRFQILSPFAHGDSGSLYLADEPATGRRGLLKILAPAAKDQLSERQRLRRELVKQSTLARSHLVVPLASGETEGLTWLFREWLDGVSLEVRLSREGALPQVEALAIAAQVASALDELHRGGLLHRDVKPGHIFLQPSPHGLPRALLLDAGLVAPLVEHTAMPFEQAVEHALGGAPARGRAIEDSNGNPVYGSAGYVAPEQLLGKLISFRSDLYSLGCALYRMLTGRPAFSGETVTSTLSAQRYGELPPLPSDLPNGIGALLRSILSKDPQQRPFSAQKLRRTLDPYLPDGALMEKQETSTYEAVPQGTPHAGAQPAPQPSGTLRPPPPPPARSSMAPGASSVPPAPPLRAGGSRSLPPPPPAQRPRPREDNTQQIDIGQIEEVREAQARGTSLPPPTPSSRPPAPPQRLSDKTQPIRLEQIMAVADSRRAAAAPVFARAPEGALRPPPKEEPAPAAPLLTAPTAHKPPARATMMGVAAPPAEPRPAQPHSRATAHGMAPPPTQPARAIQGTAPFEAPLALDADASEPDTVVNSEPPLFSHTHPGLGGVQEAEPALLSPAAEQPPLFSVLDEPLASAPSAVANMFERAAAQQARQAGREPKPAKATLMGMGLEQNSMDVTIERGEVVRPKPALNTLPLGTAEREQPTQRLPLGDTSFDADDDTGSMTMPASVLNTMRTRVFEHPRGLLYAGAGVVGFGVLVMLASALFSSDPPPVANRGSEPAAPPAVAAVAPSVAASSTAAQPPAPRPTVQPIAPAPVAAAPAELTPPPGTPRVQALAEPEPPKVAEPAPRAERDHSHHAHARDALAGSASKSKRGEPAAPKERSKSAKTSGADKTPDKTAQFAAARDDARSAYASKNYKAAAAAYERASKLDPKHAGTYAGLGSARLQLGENKAAVAAYQRAVQLSPDTSGFHAALGRAYLANGDRTKAVASYKKALQLDPKNEAARAALSQLGG
jgi:eukaryotic-like serine/threonine-protein kinase